MPASSLKPFEATAAAGDDVPRSAMENPYLTPMDQSSARRPRLAEWFGAVLLSVDVSSVAYHRDVDNFVLVIDAVDDPVRTNANTPEIDRATKLLAASRPRIVAETLDLAEYSLGKWCVKSLELFSS